MKLIIVCWLICLIQVLHSNQAQEEKFEDRKWDILSWLQELEADSEMAQSARQLAAPLLLGSFVMSPLIAYMGSMLGRGARIEDGDPKPNTVNPIVSIPQRIIVAAGDCPISTLCTSTSTTTSTTTATRTSTTVPIETATTTRTVSTSSTTSTTTTLTATSTTTSTTPTTTLVTSTTTTTTPSTTSTTTTSTAASLTTTVTTVTSVASVTATSTATTFTTTTTVAAGRADVGLNEILAEWNDSPDQLDGTENEIPDQNLNSVEKYHMRRIESSMEVPNE